MMGLDAEMMGGANGSGMMLFGWLLALELVVVMALGIVALWKHIQK